MKDPNSDPFLSPDEQSLFFNRLTEPWQSFAIEAHVADMIEVDPALRDQGETDLQTRLLVEHLGFTPDEAARYVGGDRSAIEAVAARRIAVAQDDSESSDSSSTTFKLSAD